MRPIVSIVALGALCALVIFWPGRSQGDSGPEVDYESSPSEVQESSQGVQRENVVGEVKDSSRPYWRDVEDLSIRFRTLFEEDYIHRGGEQRTINRLDEMTRTMKEKDNWKRLSGALMDLEGAGMANSPLAESLFEDVNVAEYHPIANFLGSQRVEFLEWKDDMNKEDYHFPSHKLEVMPFDFPPEMHFANLLQDYHRTAYGKEMLLQAAELRDQALYEHAQLKLEEHILMSSINYALFHLEVEIPLGERDEAIASMMPEYQNLLDAKADVKRRYVDGLAFLLGANGEVIPPRR